MQIVVSNIKGGVGKSTLVLALANVINADIIDHDNQGTIRTTSAFTGRHVPVEQATKKVVLHDTPPYNSEALKSLYASADVVVIPCKVKYPDLVATKGVVDLLRELGQTSKAVIVFNDVRKPHNKAYKEIKQLFLDNYADIRKATTELSSLVAFTRIFTDKLSGQALQEVKALAKELSII